MGRCFLALHNVVGNGVERLEDNFIDYGGFLVLVSFNVNGLLEVKFYYVPGFDFKGDYLSCGFGCWFVG